MKSYFIFSFLKSDFLLVKKKEYMYIRGLLDCVCSVYYRPIQSPVPFFSLQVVGRTQPSTLMGIA